jgi:predicted DCC family thiol-disulfide oxidoreductase YuxK
MNDGNYPLTLFYDASCALCRHEIEFLLARDAFNRLVAVDVSRPDFANDTGVPLETLMCIMHGRRPNGELVTGTRVFQLAYRAAGLGWVAGPLSWPGLAPFWDGFFAFVGHHRQLFPDWLSAAIFGRRGRQGGCRDGQCQL